MIRIPRRPRSPSPGFAAAILAALAIHAVPARAQGDLGALSDEFGSPGTLAPWTSVRAAEQWNAEPLEGVDSGVTRPGWATLMPYTVTWYADYAGPLWFKRAAGDFAVTAAVHTSGRDGVSIPASQYSLGGLMLRAPRAITPATWTPGGENYVFLSNGYGSVLPATFQFEVKTTVASQSTLILSTSPSADATLQLARLGDAVIALRREPGDVWRVHRRYLRADLPDTLQAGMVAYTNWEKVQVFPPFVHNSNVLAPPLPPGVTDPAPGIPFAPDLIAQFDYVRFARIEIPPALQGLDLTNPSAVSDADLLGFLGANADLPGTVGVGAEAAPATARLVVAGNPAPGRTRLRFALEAPGRARLALYDVAGRRVRTLADGPRAAGTHTLEWDGTDDAGAALGAGLYFAVLADGARPAAVARIHLVR